MAWPEYLILGLIGLSVIVGAWRGFIKEVFAIAVWVAAFLAAYRLSDPVAGLIGESISLPSARMAVAFVSIFVGVLVIGALISFLIGKLVEKTGLSGTDRVLGAAFGAVRGLALVLALIIVAGFTPVPSDPWWQESKGIQSLLPLADWAVSLLPENVLEYLDLHPEDTGSTETV